MSRTAQETIADFYDASETRNKPGTGEPRYSWENPTGSLYSVTAHAEADEDERILQAEIARRESRRVKAEDKVLAALLRGDRETARRLMRKHYRIGQGPRWCGDPDCC